MRKNALIALLQSMDGNPEIMVWNGLVGDVMPVEDAFKTIMHRETRSYWLGCITLDRRVSKKDPNYEIPETEKTQLLKEYSSRHPWRLDDRIRYDAQRDHKKPIIVLEPGRTGKKAIDRLGSMEY